MSNNILIKDGSGSSQTVKTTDNGGVHTPSQNIDSIAAGCKVGVVMSSGGNVSVTTNATGTTFTPFASQACTQLTIVNDTGTTIEWQQGGSGIALPVAHGSSFTIFGITNINSIGVRRVDTSNTTVAVKARWES